MRGNLFIGLFAVSTCTWLVSSFRPGVGIRPFSSTPSFCPPQPQDFVSPRIGTTKLWTSTDALILDASNVDLLQKVFDKYADKDGLMSKIEVMKVPAIAELVKSGDLLPEELDEIWDEAPKFPNVKEGDERIDVDGFVQVYRTIDDLFEGEDEEQANSDASQSADEEPMGDEDSELVEIFATIATDGKLTKEELKKWDEVETLIADTMLGEDEFDKLWDDACSSKTMDEAGFLKFNNLLDSLFDFEDEDQDDDLDEVIADTTEDDLVVVDGDPDPSELFQLLKSASGVVGFKQIKRWGELQEMIADGDILPEEVDELFENALKVSKVDDALDIEGFKAFCAGIDDLFEDEDEDTPVENTPKVSSLKGDLLRALEVMNSDEDRLPCGLESTESEENLIMELVTEIEKEGANMIRSKEGKVQPSDLAGEWEMLYSSSSAMKFNKGLSGIGGSFPNGKFDGLKQTLKATSVLMDVEYSEFISVNPSASSFNVKIDGNWFLRQSVSLFSGEPSIVLSVEPNRVTYGPTSTRADHWKSLGPMNMLDVTYLDEDLRIMRGNTAVDSIFIFKRLS